MKARLRKAAKKPHFMLQRTSSPCNLSVRNSYCEVRFSGKCEVVGEFAFPRHFFQPDRTQSFTESALGRRGRNKSRAIRGQTTKFTAPTGHRLSR